MSGLPGLPMASDTSDDGSPCADSDAYIGAHAAWRVGENVPAIHRGRGGSMPLVAQHIFLNVHLNVRLHVGTLAELIGALPTEVSITSRLTGLHVSTVRRVADGSGDLRPCKRRPRTGQTTGQMQGLADAVVRAEDASGCFDHGRRKRSKEEAYSDGKK